MVNLHNGVELWRHSTSGLASAGSTQFGQKMNQRGIQLWISLKLHHPIQCKICCLFSTPHFSCRGYCRPTQFLRALARGMDHGFFQVISSGHGWYDPAVVGIMWCPKMTLFQSNVSKKQKKTKQEEKTLPWDAVSNPSGRMSSALCCSDLFLAGINLEEDEGPLKDCASWICSVIFQLFYDFFGRFMPDCFITVFLWKEAKIFFESISVVQFSAGKQLNVADLNMWRFCDLFDLSNGLKQDLEILYEPDCGVWRFQVILIIIRV